MEIRPILSAMMRNKTAPLLIAAQVALTLAIVCNALYIIRDRLSTAARPTGADEQNLAEIRFYPHRQINDIADMQRRDLEAIKAIPGVVAATWTNQVPLGQSSWNNGGLTATRGDQNSNLGATLYFNGMGDSLIDTFGLTLVEGRAFEPDEFQEFNPQLDQSQPSLVIVTLSLAKQLFPDASSYVGKVFYMGGGDDAEGVRIVGVVERLQSPSAPASARAEDSVIFPIHYIDPFTRYSVRTEPGSQDRVMTQVEKALLALRNDRVLLGKRTFVEYRARRYSGENMMAGLLIAVTVFLLLITASGIVGMASLWVNQRRKQIGVRRALGARRQDIIRYFLLENVLITTGGVIAGLALALALNNFLVSELELPRLPVTYLGLTMLAMWILGLLAVLGPAWRAAAVPPAIATRTA
ncbi:FtsX-like permease family protein [uncultured Arenimonas sp.]|uniref:ABC transporter permease n=1 Tax=uncultured Arenimonas sp. TaxID=546226 RepID=UPI0030D8B244